MVVEDANDLDVILDGVSENISENGCAVLAEQGEFVGHEGFDADVFGRPTELIMPACASHRRGAGFPSTGSREVFYDNPAEFVEVDVLGIQTVAEGSQAAITGFFGG